jgi:signal transduction histidine kinase
VLPSTNGPVEQLVSAFAEDHSGNVWMGLYGDGVVRYRDGKFRKFGVADGVPKGYISSLYVDDAGRLWIGSYDGGLGRIDSPGADRPQVLIYDASHGLTSDHITSLTSDRWGRIYAGTGRGVDRLDPASGQAIHYTIADGLANDTPLTSWRDRRGWLWFCTTKGISRLVPEPDTPTAPPPIRITALTAGAAPYTVSELGASALSGLEFASGDLQIAFSSINFEAGESMRYQYRLEGGGGQWTAPSDQRSVNLAGLSPGGYRFEVRAVNSRGQVSEQPAAVSFSIPPPLYARQWFRLLCVVAVSLLLYGLYRFRLDRILELEHIRMRIATDLHDDIGSSLSQIAILSEVARRPGEAGAAELDPLGSIARISRELVDSMSDIVWAVNPKRDNLLDLARRMRQFAGEMLVPGGIDFTFDAAAASSHVALGADLRRQVFLIFKECINNVARHSGATQVDIVFTVSGGMLRITVRDNGRGFDPRDLLTGGHGLASMTNRAAALRGKLRIQPECGVGTTASLEIPLARHRVW